VIRVRDLANPHIVDLEPYPPGKPIEEVERELGVRGSIKLASNECPLGPSPRALEAIRKAAAGLHRYPDGSSYYLRRALAKALGVGEDQLLFGCGSDECLELLVKTFLGRGDEAVFPWPSFAMYPIVTKGMGGVAVRVPLDGELRADVSALARAVTDRTRMLFLANPNNPTGTSIGAEELQRLLASVPERVVVVCDEAYREYARREDFPDSLSAIPRRPTLVVLRTFSKIYGLAGLRIGFAVGSPELVGLLERARHPFNVSSLAQAGALAALGDDEHVARARSVNAEGVERLERGFREMELLFAPTDANFVLVRIGPNAGEVYERLLRRGVITRPMGAFGLPEWLRVTVGLPEENERLLAELAGALGR
jgi:histidinol-phosphate aminotransferase